MATDNFSPHSLGRVLGWARRYSKGTRGERITSVRRVPFDYATLDVQYPRILAALVPADSLRMSAIDETRGVIVLGVADLIVEPLARARLAAVGIPASMVQFEYSAPAVPEDGLTDAV